MAMVLPPSVPVPKKAAFSASRSLRKIVSRSLSQKERDLLEEKRKEVEELYEKKWDDEYQRFYWVNYETQASQWEDPME